MIKTLLLSLLFIPQATYTPIAPQPIPAANMVYITEGSPYTVPANKTFVLTGLGVQNTSAGALVPTIKIVTSSNKRLITRLFWRNTTSEAEQDLTPMIHFVPVGFTANAGEIVTVDNTDTTGDTSLDLGVALGYIE